MRTANEEVSCSNLAARSHCTNSLRCETLQQVHGAMCKLNMDFVKTGHYGFVEFTVCYLLAAG